VTSLEGWMSTQNEPGGTPNREITRRQLVKGSASWGMAVAAGSSISSLLGPTSASATSSVPLSDKVRCLAPAVTRCFALKCNEGYLLMSSSPGQSPTPGPLQIRTRRLSPSGSSADAARGYGPQIRTVIRGFGSEKSQSRSLKRSQVRRLRWLRRQSHLYQIRFACSMTSSRLLKLPLTPK
jgi:hypothetical protein